MVWVLRNGSCLFQERTWTIANLTTVQPFGQPVLSVGLATTHLDRRISSPNTRMVLGHERK